MHYSCYQAANLWEGGANGWKLTEEWWQESASVWFLGSSHARGLWHETTGANVTAIDVVHGRHNNGYHSTAKQK